MKKWLIIGSMLLIFLPLLIGFWGCASYNNDPSLWTDEQLQSGLMEIENKIELAKMDYQSAPATPPQTGSIADSFKTKGWVEIRIDNLTQKKYAILSEMKRRGVTPLR